MFCDLLLYFMYIEWNCFCLFCCPGDIINTIALTFNVNRAMTYAMLAAGPQIATSVAATLRMAHGLGRQPILLM